MKCASVICVLGSTPATRATFPGTSRTMARPPMQSAADRTLSVVPASATPAAAALAGNVAIGGSLRKFQHHA